MAQQRLRGQEVTILVTRGGVLEESLHVRNFTFEMKSNTTEEGYLGEKTNRTDDIYNGCGGDLELHTSTASWLAFARAVVDRQKRNTPDVIFNIAGVLAYPNGETPTLIARDVKFGNIPFNAASRGDFVTIKLTWMADDFDVQN